MALELTESISYFLDKYIVAKKESFAGHEVGNYIRNTIPYKFYNTGIIDRNKYLITGSVGQGNWATVPWLCIFDKSITETATKGIYIVYLLSSDGKSLYLTFNQGCTDIKNSHTKKETIDIMRERATKLISVLNKHNFKTDENIDLKYGTANLAEMYQKGTIFYKEYTKQNLPSEDQLRSDLKDMLEIYEEYYQKIFKNQNAGPLVQTEQNNEKEEGHMSETKQKIEQIKNYISSKGFTYEGNLIENFYLSLKSKPFVILAGTSGTGKTRLAKLFAEAIEATEENGQFKLVPVRPDWSDSSDLFGHINLDNKFVPGAILDFIKTASENLEKPYFLCLDEMNLARVEYYMSDFLSVIETRDFNSDKTVIKTSPLMSLDKYGVDEDAKQKYGTLGLPENLYIIGTVNMDETTFQFSKKVLDRANTIEFSLVDLMPKFSNSSVENQQPIEEKNNFLKSKYLKINECAAEAEFVEEGCSKLIKINDVLEKASLHIGYRVRDEIMFYMLNNKEAGNLMSDDEAFDNEIMQKILPRIQGSSQSIKNLLCELFKICAGDFTGIQTEDNSASEQMQDFIESESCIYSKSAKKIQFMTRRFEEDGFTSFWL